MLHAPKKLFEQHKVGISTTNANVNNELRKKSTTIEDLRLRFIGYCWHIKQEIIYQDIFLGTLQGQWSVERPAQLMEKTCLRIDYLPRLMEDRYGVDLSLISERCRR